MTMTMLNDNVDVDVKILPHCTKLCVACELSLKQIVMKKF